MQNKNQTLEKVKGIIAEVAELDPSSISNDASLPYELGVDSLMGLQILVELEKEFGVELNEEQLLLMTTPNNIVALLQGYEEAVAAPNV
jgi:acyl carrier protein